MAKHATPAPDAEGAAINLSTGRPTAAFQAFLGGTPDDAPTPTVNAQWLQNAVRHVSDRIATLDGDHLRARNSLVEQLNGLLEQAARHGVEVPR